MANINSGCTEVTVDFLNNTDATGIEMSSIP